VSLHPNSYNFVYGYYLVTNIRNGSSDVKKKIVNGEFTFEKLLWEKKSQCSQDFVETLLKLDPTWRPTAKRAMNHRWFRQRRNSSGFSDPQHTDDTNLFNEMRTELDFRRDAENILAFNMTVPEIFQLERMICNGAKCRKGYVSYGEFKKVLEDSKVSDKLISRIFRNINLAYDDGFEYDDFLDKIIIDCARIVEVKLAVDFEMLESRDVSREEIQELMGNQFEFLRVDEIFNSLEDNEHQLSFSRFLHLYDSHIENLPNLLKQVGTEDECTSQTSNNISIDD
jgi:serine/threonine protein kinase